MATKRILLNEQDFNVLTKGKTIEYDDVEIALSDIGYYKMLEIIRNNMVDGNFEK